MPPRNTAHKLEFPAEFLVDFDAQAFDDIIRDKGVPFVHWRAMRCPVGLVDIYDQRRPHEDHSGCSNGFLYTRAGEMNSLFTGNSAQMAQYDIGILTGSSVQVTLPRYYNDPEQSPVLVAPFDRLYLPDENIVVVHWQTFLASASGVEKLQFLVVNVADLIDSDGTVYRPGDYAIDSGRLRWSSGRRPAPGKVCSVRYTYRPYWYIKQLLHEVRVTQVEALDGERVLARMPQSALLQREYIFEKDDYDPQSRGGDPDRQVKAPSSLGLGPR